MSVSAITIVSRTYLSLLSLLFVGLACLLLIDPILALSDHAIDLSTTPASGLAEIRAYYFGTMALVAIIFIRGAFWSSSCIDRMHGLITAALLFGMFAGARVYSLYVDGPTNWIHSDRVWTAEAIGTVTSLIIYMIERGNSTTGSSTDKEASSNKNK